MSKFEDLELNIQNEFTINNLIPVIDSYYHPEQYKSLVIPNWNDIIHTYITNFTRENIYNNLHGKENYPKGDLQYNEGGASFYFCKLLDNYDVKNKKIAVIGSENPWIEAILYNYGCRDITTVEYNKPHIEHEIFKVISYYEFKNIDYKYDMIINGDIDTINTIYDHLNNDGFIGLGVPIGKEILLWNSNRIYGKIRLPLLLEKFNIIKWYGGDETCLDVEAMCGGKFAYQPILFCNKK